MSYAASLTGNVETAARRFEDNVWNKFTGSEPGLPMYKDKPNGYGYGGPGQRKGFMRSKRVLTLVALAVLTMLYWFGSGTTTPVLSDSRRKHGQKIGSPIAGLESAAKSKTDKATWEKRRQAVKDAFLLSWNAYEEHGWGTSILDIAVKKES